MTTTAAGRAAQDNGLAPDHFPACPHCGNLCGKLARLCADCGAFLYHPTADDRLVRSRLHGKPPSGEDSHP